MAQHIRNQGDDFVELTLTSHEHAVYNSFKLSVNVNDTANIKVRNFWQSGVFVRKWRDESGVYAIINHHFSYKQCTQTEGFNI